MEPALTRQLRLLAISGSLRSASYNMALLKALQQIAPNKISIQIFPLGGLPLFNADLDPHSIAEVCELKIQLNQADGLIIASPEYAHGISGVLKNALDWLVSGEEFVHLPVAIVNTSPRAHHAQAALREVVATMSGHIIAAASIAVPLLGSNLTANQIASHSEIAPLLYQALEEFYNAIMNAAEHRVFR